MNRLMRVSVTSSGTPADPGPSPARQSRTAGEDGLRRFRCQLQVEPRRFAGWNPPSATRSPGACSQKSWFRPPVKRIVICSASACLICSTRRRVSRLSRYFTAPPHRIENAAHVAYTYALLHELPQSQCQLNPGDAGRDGGIDKLGHCLLNELTRRCTPSMSRNKDAWRRISDRRASAMYSEGVPARCPSRWQRCGRRRQCGKRQGW